MDLTGGWKLAAAPDVHATGEEISTVGFSNQSAVVQTQSGQTWMAATVPGTVLTTMIDRGIYPDPDYGLNNMAIPETLAHQDYWYGVEFPTPPIGPGRHLTLTFEGVNDAAEVWLNGRKLGSFMGAFRRGNFDVTSLLITTPPTPSPSASALHLIQASRMSSPSRPARARTAEYK